MTDRPPSDDSIARQNQSDGRRRHTLADLLHVMAALRTPGSGCPWDLEQTFATIAPYTIEEAYEVADAIQRGDLADLEEELGDLLLQVVYHARMAEEAGAFDFADVADAITAKMIRRHPHVFGTEEERAAGAQPGFWSRIKAAEKAEKAALRARLGQQATATRSTGSGGGDTNGGAPGTPLASLLDDVPAAMPALTRALELQDKAAKVGFDWPSLAPVFDKMREELAELEEVALPLDPRGGAATSRRDGSPSPREDFGAPDPDRAKVEEEFGDLLFVMANVARHLRIDAEAALRAANHKFTRRFHHIERRLADRGSSPAASTLAEMDALWDEAKLLERARAAQGLLTAMPEPD
jgi:ATP diphosphatase